MPQRVGFVIVSGEFGGAETVLHTILRRIDTTAFDVSVFANEVVADAFRGVPDVDVFSLGPLSYRSYRAAIGLDAAYRRASTLLADRCRERDIELLLLNLPGALRLLTDSLSTTNVFVMHGATGFEETNPRENIRYLDTNVQFRLRKILSNRLKKYTNRRLIERVDHVICTCAYFADLLDLNGITVERSIIENGVDLSIRRNRTTVIDTQRPAIVYCGGARDVKGWDLLVDAVLQLRASDAEFTMYVLRDVPDDHPMRERLSAQGATDSVDFVGFCDRGRYLDYLYSGDIFCLPSYSESISISLLESMAFGKPVVATDVGGTAEVVEHERNGYLCSATPGSVAAGLQYYLGADDRMATAQHANLTDVDRFAWERVIGNYESFIDMACT